MNNRIYLKAEDLPRQWYNVAADVKQHLAPPIDPGTGKPLDPSKLLAIFPEALVEQEASVDRWVDIPEPVLEQLAVWRPSPLFRALQLEKFLQTPARIYYKYEGGSPPGSHKPNTAIAQAYYNKQAGTKRLTTETGAGQWGSALSYACHKFGLQCKVYMVRCSYEQKPLRRTMMHLWGADVVPSPTDTTQSGRAILAKDPKTSGSLGIAISEAVEDAATHPDTHYSLGSVLNHVMLHQTVIGLELKKQLEIAGETPDVLIGCCGGGSNFAGAAFPFVPDKLEGKKIRLVAVEPASCPSLTRGSYTYDFGDTAKLTPLLKMYTLGHDFIPPAIHAGGLRYHGMAPLVSLLVHLKIVEAVAVHQLSIFEAAHMFIKTEGVIPAPETAHALRVVIDEALDAKKKKEERVIVVNFSGHGLCDMGAYELYMAGRLEDYEYPQEQIARSLAALPKVNL